MSGQLGGPQGARDADENSNPNPSASAFSNPLKSSSSQHLPMSSQDLLRTSAPNLGERTLYEQENTRLRTQNEHLAAQALRLTNELRGFQVLHPYPSLPAAAALPSSELPPWMAEEAVMSPLLAAYDARIQELGSVTERQRLALDSFAEQCEQLVAENELLRENQLKDLRGVLERGDSSSADPYRGDSSSADLPSNLAGTAQAADLEERVRILMEENSLMAEQSAILSKELEGSQTNIMEREGNIINLTQSLSDAAAAMQQLESDNSELVSSKRQCEDQLLASQATSLALEQDLSKAKSSVREISSLRSTALLTIEELRSEKTECEQENDDLCNTAKVSPPPNHAICIPPFPPTRPSFALTPPLPFSSRPPGWTS
jgi:hypothetical protein